MKLIARRPGAVRTGIYIMSCSKHESVGVKEQIDLFVIGERLQRLIDRDVAVFVSMNDSTKIDKVNNKVCMPLITFCMHTA